MSGMTYEARKRGIFEWLYRTPGGLLHRYRMPEHLSDDAIRDEVNLLVEDVNKLIPNEYVEADLQALLIEVNSGVRRRHGAQGWPPARVLIAATEDAVQVVSAAKVKASSAPKPNDPLEAAAGRMRRGEAIGDFYLWGVCAVEMLHRGLVDQATIDRYRAGAIYSRRKVYGSAAADAWAQDMAAKHALAQRDHDQRSAA